MAQFLLVAAISTFTYNDESYCLPGFVRIDGSPPCVPAQSETQYSAAAGGVFLEACRPGVLHSLPRTFIGVNNASGRDNMPEFCEICARGGALANYSRCAVFSDDQHVDNCAEYVFEDQKYICWRCAAEYVPTVDNKCEKRVLMSGCRVYSTDVASCTKCEVGFVLEDPVAGKDSEFRTCREITNCDEDHRGDNSCLKCEANYFYDAATKTCERSCGSPIVQTSDAGEEKKVVKMVSCGVCREYDENCETFASDSCESQSKPIPCQRCKSGFYVKTQDSQCGKCGENCTECKDGTAVCTKCKDGTFQNTSANSSSCGECDPNCVECESESKCKSLKCKEGYYFSDEKIIQIPNCATNTTDICEIAASNCAQCRFVNINGSNSFFCDRCKAHYSLTSDGKACVKCTVKFCEHCSEEEKCDLCKENFTLSPAAIEAEENADSGAVKPLCVFNRSEDANCAVFDENNLCVKCHPGYTADRSGLCVYMYNCTELDASGEQLKCRDCGNATLNSEGLCEDPGCDETDNTTHECVRCKNGSGEGGVALRDTGYFLAGGACYPCDPSCATCENVTLADSSRCTKAKNTKDQFYNFCKDIYYYSACSTCPEGHFLDSLTDQLTGQHPTYLCYPCSYLDPACSGCDENGTCTICNDGYALIGGFCAPCEDQFGAGCLTCSNNSCLTAQSLNIIFEGRSMSCEDAFGECKTCKEQPSAAVEAAAVSSEPKKYACTVPKPAAWIAEDGHAYFCGDDFCKECEKTVSSSSEPTEPQRSTDRCASCESGYFLQDNLCRPCAERFGAACFACNASACTQCAAQLTFDKDAGECVSCRARFGSACAACDTRICLECRAEGAGFDIYGNICKKCASGCFRCVFQTNEKKNQEICLECANPREILEGGTCRPVQPTGDSEKCLSYSYSVDESNNLALKCVKCVDRSRSPEGEECVQKTE